MSDRKTDTVSTSQQSGNQASPVSRVPANKNKIDVINLSSQLTSMELLSKRKAKKRVRFELPETDIRAASSQDYASFQKDSNKKQKKVKQLTIYNGGRSTLDADVVREEGSSGSVTYDEPEADKSLLEYFHPNIGDDYNQIIPAKRSKTSKADTLDDNNNCSNNTKQYMRRKMLLARRNLNRAKKKKDRIGLDKKLSRHLQALLTKTVKELNAQKKANCRKNKVYSLKAKKTNYTNFRRSESKEKLQKTIMCKGQIKKTSSKKSTISKHRRERKIPSRRDIKRENHKDKLGRDASTAKSLKNKAMKRKLAIQKRRKEQAAKRRARKKAEMKKKLAEKRKKLRQLKEIKAKKVEHKTRKPKKPKFIPITREEEVSNSMRVNLLIYRTFQKASDDHLHCCSRRCWKDWEELDMEDVYIDFE